MPLLRTLSRAEALESRTLLSLLPAGGPFAVHDGPPAIEHSPQAAMDADGDFVVVWESSVDDEMAILARRHGPDGAPRGEAFRVSPAGRGAVRGDVAMDDAGNFVVTYVGITYKTPGGPSDPEVYARRFDADGEPVGDEIQVDPGGHPRVGNAGEIAAAMSGDGSHFVVTWAEPSPDHPTSGTVVLGRLFNAAGTPVGEVFRAHEVPSLKTIASTDAAMDADGDFVITWSDIGPPAGHDPDDARPRPSRGVFARRFDSTSAPVTADIAVTAARSGDSNTNPAAAMDADGDFVVAWREGGPSGRRVLARRFGAAGNPAGEPTAVATYGQGFDTPLVDVASHDDGGFVVAWRLVRNDGHYHHTHWIYARDFDAAGAPLNEAALIHQNNSGGLPFISVAADAAGDRGVVTWDRDDGAFPARDQNIYGGLLAQSDGTRPPPQGDFPPTAAAVPEVKLVAGGPPQVVSLWDAFEDDRDPDAALAFDASPFLPFARVSIDPATGTLTLTPDEGTAGGADLAVNATDTAGMTTTLTLRVVQTAPGREEPGGGPGGPRPRPVSPARPGANPGRPRDLRGVIYDDADGNGRKSRREAGIDGVRVYLDLNHSGAPDAGEPTAVTAPDGTYQLTGDRAAARSVAVVLPAGLRYSAPWYDVRAFPVAAGPYLFKAGPIGLTRLVSVGGEVYLDANRNALPEAGEPRGPRTRVFLDANGDGLWQKGQERTTLTDRRGRYAFTNLPVGAYRVGILAPRGHAPTRAWPGGVIESLAGPGMMIYSYVGMAPTP